MFYRELGVYEKLAYLINITTAHNLVSIVNYKGHIDNQIMVKAAAFIKKQHAVLGCVVQEKKETFFYVEDKQPNIPIVFTKLGKGSIDEVVERELNYKFNLEEELPIKITIVESNQINSLIVCASHAVSDAVPMLRLSHSILNLYSSIQANQNIKINGAGSKQPLTIDHYMRRRKQSAFDETIKKQQHVSTSPENLRTIFSCVALSESSTEKLKIYCRNSHNSIHNILASAAIKALQKFLLKDTGIFYSRIGLSTLIDLRRIIKECDNGYDDLRHFSSSFFSQVAAEKEQSIESMANAIKFNNINLIKEGKHLCEYGYLKQAIDNLHTSKEIFDILYSDAPSVCISSLSDISLDCCYGKLKVESSMVLTSTHSYTRNKKRFLFVPQMINGKLILIVEASDPIYKKKELEDINSMILSTLETLIE